MESSAARCATTVFKNESVKFLAACRHTSLWFFVLFAAPLRARAAMRRPLHPSHTGLHPVTPLGFGPRSECLFSYSLRSWRKQTYSRGRFTVPSMGEGACTKTLLVIRASPYKSIALLPGSAAENYRTAYEWARGQIRMADGGNSEISWGCGGLEGGGIVDGMPRGCYFLHQHKARSQKNKDNTHGLIKEDGGAGMA